MEFNTAESGWESRVLSRFSAASVSDESIANLAMALGASGTVRRGNGYENDLASTGGAGSLTTFLSPLLMVHDGASVPKIGVPGRPAGVIDSLGSVPQYRTSLTGLEFEKALSRAQFANALASGQFAPADGTLFRARQLAGMQRVPALVVASLLSKKIAAGLERCTIDIRVGKGQNFGESQTDAAANATLLKRVGRMVQIEVTTVFSRGDLAAQPHIGRLEALEALLLVVTGQATGWLAEHVHDCVKSARVHDPELDQREVSFDRLAQVLKNNLQAQGVVGGIDALARHVKSMGSSASYAEVRAGDEGYVQWDTNSLRSTLVDEQAMSDRPAIFPDPAGITLIARDNERVRRGDLVAMARHFHPDAIEPLASRVLSAVTLLASRLN